MQKTSNLIRLPHDEFLERFRLIWVQGQHVSVAGATGSGKTTVAQEIEDLRDFIVVIATKANDESLDRYKMFIRREKWPPHFNEHKVMFWVKPRVLGDFTTQRRAVYAVMSDVFKVGGWTVYFDDLYYVSETLGLKRAVQMFYTQVRSNHVSIVASIQRPFWVPVEVLGQSTYTLLFATRDEQDIKRISQGMSIPFRELLAAIGELEEYEFLFLQTGKAPIIIKKKEM